MVVDLEIVPACVRHDAAVEHMNFADGPAVEPQFLERVFEQIRFPHLQVAKPRPQPAHASAGGNATDIFVVGDPAERADAAVNIGKLHEFQVLDT